MNEQLTIIIKAEMDGVKKAVSDAKKEIGGLDTQTSKSSNSITQSLAKIGKAMAAAFSVKMIVDFTKELINCASTVAAEQSAYSQIMGNYADEATKKLQQVANETGITDTRLTASMTSMTAKWKGLGYGVEEATTYAQRGLTLAADASAFWDMSLDESTSHLNSFINGSYEGGEAIGLFANDTQMALYAVEKGLISDTKEWANLDEAQKQATRLEYAENMMKASGATGQAAKEAEAYANVQANLNEKWRQFKAQIGEPILQNIVVPAMKLLSAAIDEASEAYETIKTKIDEFKTNLQGVGEWCSEHSTALTLIGIAIAGITAAIIAYNAAAIAKTVIDAAETVAIWALIAAETAHSIASGIATAATTAFGAAMAFLTSPVTLVILAITALIAIIVLCVKHWDEIKEVAIKVWNKIKEAVSVAVEAVIGFFANLKEKATEIWENIKTAISEKVDALKTAVTEKFQAIKDGIADKIEAAKTAVTNKFDQIKTNIGNKIDAAKTAVSNKFDAIKTTISTKVENAKSAVTTKFETMKSNIKTKIDGIKSQVTSVFNSLKDKITSPVESAKNKVKNLVDKIKGLFKFKWSLPALKKPYFTISPAGWKVGDLLKGTIPKLSVGWHAQGGVFDSPTLFSYKGGLHGLGENGAEAIVPLEKNTEWLTRIADMLNERMGGGTPIILQVDGKTFAQTCVDTMNDLTRQTGNLPLKLV